MSPKPINLVTLLTLSLGLGLGLCQEQVQEEEQLASFWLRQAQGQLQERLARTRDSAMDQRRAKNVVLLLGDGLSITTLTAARILKGQRGGESGEEALLAVERFPYSGLCKTYCVNAQIPDSACTSTAYLGGVKTRSGCVGQSASGEPVDSVMQWAQLAGMATGVVTTTRLTDASPAGGYAHVRRRGEELEIARQLMEEEPGRNFQVILGGGLGKFADERRDGKDLLHQWRESNPGGCFAHNLAALKNCSGSAGSLLGIFSDNHMPYHLAASKEQPRLSDLTAAALEKLEQRSRQEPGQGYFVFIEGGRIDHGHHETRVGYALDETLEFDAAVETAVRLTDPSETLLVVTSDHSHTLSMAGNAGRGTSILGMDEQQLDLDGVPYSTLNYAVGKWQSLDPGGRRMSPRKTLSPTSFTPSYIKGRKGVHSGEDVAVFAMGPQAHLFGGIMEQNLLPHLMGYAACLGRGVTLCNQQKDAGSGAA